MNPLPLHSLEPPPAAASPRLPLGGSGAPAMSKASHCGVQWEETFSTPNN